MRCTCRKKGLQCVDMCLCVNYNNDEEDNINEILHDYMRIIELFFFHCVQLS